MTLAMAEIWLLIASLILTVCLGTAIIAPSVRTVFVSRSALWATVCYGILGGTLLLSAVWTSFVVSNRYADGKMERIHALVNKQQNENAALLAKIEAQSKIAEGMSVAMTETILIIESMITASNATSSGYSTESQVNRAAQRMKLEDLLAKLQEQSPEASPLGTVEEVFRSRPFVNTPFDLQDGTVAGGSFSGG